MSNVRFHAVSRAVFAADRERDRCGEHDGQRNGGKGRRERRGCAAGAPRGTDRRRFFGTRAKRPLRSRSLGKVEGQAGQEGRQAKRSKTAEAGGRAGRGIGGEEEEGARQPGKATAQRTQCQTEPRGTAVNGVFDSRSAKQRNVIRPLDLLIHRSSRQAIDRDVSKCRAAAFFCAHVSCARGALCDAAACRGS